MESIKKGRVSLAGGSRRIRADGLFPAASGSRRVKALSIQQPWAWLIVTGKKDVENRSWPTDFRGRFLVHAGRAFDMEGYRLIRSRTGMEMPEPDAFERGGIVGEAEIVDCVRRSSSPWFSGPYGFVLRKARQVPFRRMPGKLRFFDVEDFDAIT